MIGYLARFRQGALSDKNTALSQNLIHICWNAIGLAIPLLVAVISIPGLLHRLGGEVFGLLSLCWALLGYASIMDLGIGRAVTRKIAQANGQPGSIVVGDLHVTAVRITIVVSLLGSAIVALLAQLGAYRAIKFSAALDHEVQQTMFIMALVLPLQALSTTYRGINEGLFSFKSVSFIRAFVGATTFLGPWAISLLSSDLRWLALALLGTRIASMLLYAAASHRALRNSGNASGAFSSMGARELVGFGGWITLSALVAPLLVQSDRFVIGALRSASDVAAYTIPYEMVVQVLVVVGAASTVAFPYFSRMASGDRAAFDQSLRRWLVIVSGTMLALLSALGAMLPTLIEIWIGIEPTSEQVRVGQILCVGVLANSVGTLLVSHLHANNFARSVCLLLFIETPIYLTVMGYLITAYGIVGAAAAWSLRMTVDTTGLIIIYELHRRKAHQKNE